MIALLTFTVFFSLLQSAGNNILAGCGWYGCNFSGLFAIAGGFLTKIIISHIPKAQWIVYPFIVSLILSSLWNVRLLNYAWLAMHHREHYWELDMWLNKKPREEFYEKYYARKSENSFKNNFAITNEA